MSITKYLRNVFIVALPSLAVIGAVLIADVEISEEASKIIDPIAFILSGFVVGWLYAYDYRVSTPESIRLYIGRFALISLGFTILSVLSAFIGGGFNEILVDGVPVWVIPLGILLGFVKGTGLLCVGGGLGYVANARMLDSKKSTSDA